MAESKGELGVVGPIPTFVFLDIETTGLPEYNFGKANITELAMWTVLREDLLASGNTETPRLLGKWTTVFNPAMLISQKSTEITGLSNEMLENYAKFDDDATTAIISYLKRYPKPICLIAHNGNGFDFDIIKQSFDKIHAEIPDFLWCSDSLRIFRELDSIAETHLLAQKSLGEEKIVPLTENSEKSPPETVEQVSQPLIENLLEGLSKSELSMDNQNELFDEKNIKILERQRVNETTPRRSIQEKYLKMYTRPSNKNTLKQTQGSAKTSKARKELFPSTQVTSDRVVKKQMKSFKLGDIYERIYNCRPVSAHAAEADVETLFKISRKYGAEFVELAEKTAIPFAQFKKTKK